MADPLKIARRHPQSVSNRPDQMKSDRLLEAIRDR